MSEPSAPRIHTYELTVPAEAVDGNGHVNNVHYVQWMQDAAISHFRAIGGNVPMREAGATWVVRSHHIEYLSPAFAGDRIDVHTWIANVRRVRSLRRYRFVRVADGKVLAEGETDWVFVDAKTGRPLAIPDAVSSLFPLAPDGMDA